MRCLPASDSVFCLEVTHEKITHAALPVPAAVSMSCSGHDDKIEILVRLDERIDETFRRLGGHISVHLTDDQHEVALKAVGIVNVRGR